MKIPLETGKFSEKLKLKTELKLRKHNQNVFKNSNIQCHSVMDYKAHVI